MMPTIAVGAFITSARDRKREALMTRAVPPRSRMRAGGSCSRVLTASTLSTVVSRMMTLVPSSSWISIVDFAPVLTR